MANLYLTPGLISHLATFILTLITVFYLIYRRYKSENRDTQIYLSKLEESIAERTKELQETNDLLRSEIKKHEDAEARLTEQQRKIVAVEEREQMARELQDSFGQVIGYINVQAQAVRTLLSKNEIEAAQENLQLLVQAAQGAHADLRSYILGLSDAEKHSHSFFESLRTYLNAFSRAWEIETIFSVPQDTLPILPETVEDQILQIFQEALVNIRKYAGATRVEVLMTFLPRELILVISDNGRGFDPQTAPGSEQKHFGLSIMRGRAEQVGGRMEVRSVIGQGAQVVVHIPRIVSSSTQKQTSPRELLGLRVLLADDQPLFLEGMRNLLTSRGLTVIGLARDGFEAVEQARALRPDIVMMDVQMPKCSGVEAARLIKAEFPETKVILLTGAENGNDLLEAVKLGVSGYFLKNMDANNIFSQLVAVIHGEMAIPPMLVSNLLTELPRTKDAVTEGEELTSRQWEILQLVAKDLTYKEVARVLNIGEVTVKYHMGQILERLRLKNREQAVKYAVRMMSK
jgi:DNA-binding NarL/FixJ family response regulator/signal transduction histidine kinase